MAVAELGAGATAWECWPREKTVNVQREEVSGVGGDLVAVENMHRPLCPRSPCYFRPMQHVTGMTQHAYHPRCVAVLVLPVAQLRSDISHRSITAHGGRSRDEDGHRDGNKNRNRRERAIQVCGIYSYAYSCDTLPMPMPDHAKDANVKTKNERKRLQQRPGAARVNYSTIRYLHT